MGMLAAARPAGAAGEKRTGFYVMETFYLQQGSQVERMREYFSKLALPALQKAHHNGPAIVLESLVAPHMPQMVAFYGFQSLEDMWGVHTRIHQDAELMKNFEQWDSGEPAFDQQSSIILQAADYSPEIVAPAEPAKTSRVFELRVYHSPTWRQLKALHERFAGPEIQIFHRVGVNPILYSSTYVRSEHAQPHLLDSLRKPGRARKGLGRVSERIPSGSKCAKNRSTSTGRFQR